MNIAELASQFYNLTIMTPIHLKMKRKSKRYFATLHKIRCLFAEKDLHHTCLDSLTSLVYAFNRNVTNMSVYGYNVKYRNSILANTNQLERSIIKVISHCNDVLTNHKMYERRSI